MARWVCPTCQREFGRVRQSHECAPAMSVDDYFSTGDPREREVFDAVMAHLDSVGPVYVEPVSVGIFLKAERKFAELRPKTRWVALSVSLTHAVDHPRLGPKVVLWSGRYFHVFNLRTADDLDDRIRRWLTEAYLLAAEP